jgi:transcriptional regulator with XRE-family HTH domain
MSDNIKITRTTHEKESLTLLGKRLKVLRAEASLTQEELCDKAGFSRSYYAEVETGKRNPSYLNLVRISEALEVSLHKLVSDEGHFDDT